MSVQQVVIKTDETGSQAPATQTAQRPEHIPEKFWKDGKVDVEGMAKSYVELEKKQSVPVTEKKPDEKTVTLTPADKAREAVEKAGFDMKALSKEFLENGGKLSDETLKTLTDKGISNDAVNSYIAGVQAGAQAIVTEITAAAGGDEKLKAIYQWAEAKLSKDEIAAYNSIMDAGNKLAAKLAFGGLLARFSAENGEEPTLVTAESTPSTTGVKPFDSNAQVVAAMSDKRYANDPAYRKEVEKRMAVTDLFAAGR